MKIKIRINYFLIIFLCVIVTTNYLLAQNYDIAVVGSENPQIGSTIPTGQAFTPKAKFRNMGSAEVSAIKVRFEIISISGPCNKC